MRHRKRTQKESLCHRRMETKTKNIFTDAGTTTDTLNDNTSGRKTLKLHRIPDKDCRFQRQTDGQRHTQRHIACGTERRTEAI